MSSKFPGVDNFHGYLQSSLQDVSVGSDSRKHTKMNKAIACDYSAAVSMKCYAVIQKFLLRYHYKAVIYSYSQSYQGAFVHNLGKNAT